MEAFFEKLIVFRSTFERISNGELLKPIVAWMFRIAAFLIVLFVLVFTFKSWKANAGGQMTVGYFFGEMVTTLIILFGTFCAFNLLLIRAHQIVNSPVNEHYPLVPLIVIVMKTMGEVYCAFMITVGVTLLFGILSGLTSASLNQNTVLGPIIPAFPALGIFGLFAMYYAAEILRVSTDVALQTRR